MAFYPYLFFGGDCRAAFTRYHEIFGGDLNLITAADMPAEEQMPGASSDTIMHAALTFGDDLLMGSDDPTAESFGPVQGMMVNYDSADPDRVKAVFEGLSDGGEVTQPLTATSFSPAFGMCTDRFGTPWMISASQE